MTSHVISSNNGATTSERWRPIGADLLFWSLAGSTVAVLCEPLGRWWGVPSTALLAGGLAFVAVGVVSWFGLRRITPTPRRLLVGFGAANLLLAPALWAVGWWHGLPVTPAGNWALGAAGDVALLLGAWQLISSRRS